MCLLAFAWRSHPRYRLALIGNRDEFHARATRAAEFEPDAPQVYGGRDLERQGGWLQLSQRRRLAAVTNVRAGLQPAPAARSRGELVAAFVRASTPLDAHLEALLPHANAFGRFNLLLWDGRALALAGNHPAPHRRRVDAGVHGLSNGAFDAPWPKVRRARAALQRWIADDARHGAAPLAPLFEALADTREADDDELPDTGVGLELERRLSPPFVRGTHYGTRCSSIVLVGDDEARFVERRFGAEGVLLGESDARIELG